MEFEFIYHLSSELDIADSKNYSFPESLELEEQFASIFTKIRAKYSSPLCYMQIDLGPVEPHNLVTICHTREKYYVTFL